MLSLVDTTVDGLVLHGYHYKLDLAFDNVLKWYRLLEDGRFNQIEKIDLGYRMFTINAPKNADLSIKVDVIQAISDFLKEDPYENVSEAENQPNNGGSSSKNFSFEKDAGVIWASFFQYYHIDLENEIGKLHWDKFTALLYNLPSKSQFKQIIDIRGKDLSKIDNADERANIQMLQVRYSLQEKQNVEQLNQSMGGMFDSLWDEAKK